MIDVVFLLLVFFLVVTQPLDVLLHLDVSRPRVEGGETPLTVLRIEVLADGYMVNEKAMALSEMDQVLGKLSGYSTSMSVVVSCAPDSQHDGLVQALNLCAKNGLRNLSLVNR
jgi:biopolymer transport protein ExbD